MLQQIYRHSAVSFREQRSWNNELIANIVTFPKFEYHPVHCNNRWPFLSPATDGSHTRSAASPSRQKLGHRSAEEPAEILSGIVRLEWQPSPRL